jgi:hypothetical protein
MKRAMAGEYSRELSVKVFTGQCRLIRLGFRKAALRASDCGVISSMSIGSPRPSSVAASRRAANRPGHFETRPSRRGRGGSAALPDVRGATTHGNRDRRSTERGRHFTDLGRPWTRGTVHQVLTNEKYIGNNVYNRASFKLKAKRVVNTPDMCATARSRRSSNATFRSRAAHHPGAQPAFQRRGIAEPPIRPARREGMALRACHRRGRGHAIEFHFPHRFGSLVRAYQLVGYAPSRDYRYIETNKALRALHPDVVAQVITDRRGRRISCRDLRTTFSISMRNLQPRSSSPGAG